MKNTTIKLAIATMVIAFSFSACKKDYNCKCTTTDGAATATTVSPLGKMSKSDAETKCNYTSTYGSSTTTCALE